jgi:hypothetical protein
MSLLKNTINVHYVKEKVIAERNIQQALYQETESDFRKLVEQV